MHEPVEQFRDYYADQFSVGMSDFLRLHGQSIISELQAAAGRRRSTIYLFGNGGSHAISKCIEYALQTYASTKNLPLRVQTGIDIHKSTLLLNTNHPGTSFVDVLEIEGADSSDLIVLISGSGDSDNLCEVADYAKSRGLPIFALLGSRGGKLNTLLPRERRFSVPFVDQQISEDIIQSLTCFLGNPLPAKGSDWAQQVGTVEHDLRNAIRAIPLTFIESIADTVVEAFFTRKSVWVLGVDHPALSVCAEHVAHNLYWDGIFEVSNPPPRLVFSSPTACDFSGISNDRRRGVIEVLTGISDFEGDGVALLYSMSSGCPTLVNLLNHLNYVGVPSNLVFADGKVPRGIDSLTAHRTGLKTPQLQSLLSQVFGHMLGRLVRLRLIERNGSDATHIPKDPGKFLINYDLAQRRLLDA